MSEHARQLGEGDEPIQSQVVRAQTTFEQKVGEKVAARKRNIRGGEIRVFPAAGQSTVETTVGMQERIEGFFAEMKALNPAARKARREEIQKNDPEFFVAIQDHVKNGHTAIKNQLNNVHAIGEQGKAYETVIQSSLNEVASETRTALDAVLKKSEPEHGEEYPGAAE